MRFKKLHYCLTVLFAGVLFATLTSLSTGIAGQSTAGCTCHSASPNAATIIGITGRPTGGYVNGQTYNLSLTVSNPAQLAAGFNMTVSTGTLSTSGTGTILVAAQEMTHAQPRTMTAGTATWTFNWTAPATGSATATFNIGGNAVNLNGANDIGDSWNLATITIAAAASGPAIPTITVGTPSGITASGATVNGTVNANNAATAVSLEYGLTTGYGQTAAVSPANVTGTIATAISSALSGLAANTLYHYRIKAVNSVGTAYSPDATFTTAGPAALPVIAVGTPTGITAVAAVVNATVNAGNASTSVSMQYGLTTAYGTTATVTPSPVAGNTATPVSSALSGLAPVTTYHYRFVAVNSAGTVNSPDYTFTTLTNVAAPAIVAGTPSGITTTGATINGTVNANNASTTVTVEYGLSAAYGSTVNAAPNVVTGNTPASITAAVSGLAASTTYHYRIVAVNSAGTTRSPDQTFTTTGLPGMPVITLAPASNISYNRGVVNALVNANNQVTNVSVEYGLTTAYGSTVNGAPTQVTGSSPVAILATLSQLSPATVYHYRVIATNSSGTARSQDATLTTTSNNVGVRGPDPGKFQLFPNPAKDLLLLVTKELLSIRVADMSGKLVNIVHKKAGADKYELDISSLSPGSYLLILQRGDGTYTSRFSKAE